MVDKCSSHSKMTVFETFERRRKWRQDWRLRNKFLVVCKCPRGGGGGGGTVKLQMPGPRVSSCIKWPGLEMLAAGIDSHITSLCSAENSLQAQISNSMCSFVKQMTKRINFANFFRCFPMIGQLSLFLSEASEVVLIYSGDQIWAKLLNRTSASCIVVKQMLHFAPETTSVHV